MMNQVNHELQDFQTDVLDESFNRPVVVDFWAEWCGPCKALGPVLEKLEQKSEGAWKLVKVNTDVNPDLAQMFRIRSIPLVKMFKDGKEVDEFVGALPEQKVSEWLQKHITAKTVSGFDAAYTLLEEGRIEEAVQQLELLLPTEEGVRAKVLLAKIFLFDDTERAQALIKDIEPHKNDWDIHESLKMLLHVFELATKPDELTDAIVKENMLTALQKITQQEFSEALILLIGIIREDRYYMNDLARQICIAIFKYLGEEHPVTLTNRRPFGSALYV